MMPSYYYNTPHRNSGSSHQAWNITHNYRYHRKFIDIVEWLKIKKSLNVIINVLIIIEIEFTTLILENET